MVLLSSSSYLVHTMVLVSSSFYLINTMVLVSSSSYLINTMVLLSSSSEIKEAVSKSYLLYGACGHKQKVSLIKEAVS